MTNQGGTVQRLYDPAALYEAALSLLRIGEMEALARALVRLLEQQLPFQHTAILLIEPGSDRMRPFITHSRSRKSPAISHSQNNRVRAFDLRVGLGVTGYVAQTGQPLRLGDVTADPRSLAPRPGMRSELCVPLLLEDRCIGVWDVMSEHADAYTLEDERWLCALARIAAVAIENARRLTDWQRERAELSRLSARMVQAQEEERRRLARGLHDEIGQVLTAVKVELQGLRRQLDAPAAARLDESVALVESALQRVRALALDLRPSLLDDLGLVVALRSYLERLAERSGLSIRFQADPPELRLPPELETTCFRIAQEALTNVLRHAQARQVEVALSQTDDGVQLQIQDDGIGFDVPAALEGAAQGKSMGLLSMRERVWLAGGTLEIASTPGRGSRVCARFPLTSMQGG